MIEDGRFKSLLQALCVPSTGAEIGVKAGHRVAVRLPHPAANLEATGRQNARSGSVS